jgi:hypothetical protein
MTTLHDALLGPRSHIALEVFSTSTRMPLIQFTSAALNSSISSSPRSPDALWWRPLSSTLLSSPRAPRSLLIVLSIAPELIVALLAACGRGFRLPTPLVPEPAAERCWLNRTPKCNPLDPFELNAWPSECVTVSEPRWRRSRI